VLTAVIVGISLFGILGAIVAIPVAGCLRVLAKDWVERRHNDADHHEHMQHKAHKVLKEAK
jgi:predicted PurR-regulated permease PerM